MSLNQSKAPQEKWSNTSSNADFLHLIGPGGQLLGGIDASGVSQGSMFAGGVVTKTLYVDGNRTDSYTQTGSITAPFKTIMGAVNQVIANGDNSLAVAYKIDIATGTYNEVIVLENSNLVNLTFDGHNTAKVGDGSHTAGLQTTANNSNLARLVFQEVIFGGGGNNGFTITENGNTFSDRFEFFRCDITINAWTYTSVGTTQFNLYDSNLACLATWNNVGGGFFGSKAIGTGSAFNLTNNSLFQIARGARNGGTVSVDATSELVVVQARQDGAVTLASGGAFLLSRMGHITGAITVGGSGSTFEEHGGYHDSLTINAGGVYTLIGTVASAGQILGSAAPTVQSGQVGLGSTTAATATAGAATLPANPLGFLIANIGGTTVKIPYYNN